MEPLVYRKDLPLKYPVIRKTKGKLHFFKVALVIIIFLALYSLTISKNPPEQLSNINISDAILLILGIIIIFAVNYYVLRFRFAGEITVTDSEIILNTTNKSLRIPVNEIKNLKMLYNKPDMKGKGLAGTFAKFSFWLFGSKGKAGNFIEFEHNDNAYKLEVYLHSDSQEDFFCKRAAELGAMNSLL
jgi:hypothetical protein